MTIPICHVLTMANVKRVRTCKDESLRRTSVKSMWEIPIHAVGLSTWITKDEARDGGGCGDTRLSFRENPPVDKRQLGLFGADQLPLDQQNKFGQLGLSFRALCTIRSGDLNHPGRCCGRVTPKMTRVEIH